LQLWLSTGGGAAVVGGASSSATLVGGASDGVSSVEAGVVAGAVVGVVVAGVVVGTTVVVGATVEVVDRGALVATRFRCVSAEVPPPLHAASAISMPTMPIARSAFMFSPRQSAEPT
jgi:hypothetical protein